LLPRKTLFYDLLEEQADNVVTLCERFHALVHEFDDLEGRQAAIRELEHVGDRLTHELFAQMHATFVTPLDKDDLAALAGRLDDVADYVEAAADRLVLYRIQQPSPEAREQADLLVAAARVLTGAVHGLRDLRQRDEIAEAGRQLHELERRSDAVYRRALGELFNSPGADPILVLKWKEIYERMETAVDKCEDVADVIEGILLKYA
jgi:predicted phosphate transport protein (TIGR00153 family)